LNYKEIAHLLNITVSRVSQIHSRIISSLKTKLVCLQD
ncbi:MAG: RNA polymerase sigma factor WhiG, partial [Ignavibacteria bacterium]|nr:RNA polymerase sigma factor WhiG [Ignavibacteria bacterium]